MSARPSYKNFFTFIVYVPLSIQSFDIHYPSSFLQGPSVGLCFFMKTYKTHMTDTYNKQIKTFLYIHYFILGAYAEVPRTTEDT